MSAVKKHILLFVIPILLYCLASCDIFDSHKHLVSRYYLNHTKFGKCICYQTDNESDFVELVNGAFRRIGFDDNYIIVEKSRYEFLIIKVDKENTYFPEKEILGPLNAADFKLQKQKLNIKADFTINSD